MAKIRAIYNQAMEKVNNMEILINDLAVFIWTWNVGSLVGSGVLKKIYSKLTPFKYIIHAFELLRGKHTQQEDIGEVTHFQALMTALSATVGTGNIAGVATAIFLGGPGAIFWMWVTALFWHVNKILRGSIGC